MMRILLTNDDGYRAEGIKVLEEVLSSRGHEIWVIAPEDNCSAFSHKMTCSGPVRMRRYAPHHYACSGTPTDCILYGSKARFLPSAPDLVVSGINHGGNLSTDILYSGTCAAANEAALHSIRAIAISAEPDKTGAYDFYPVANFLADNLDAFYPLLNDTRFLNINGASQPVSGPEVARLGIMKYPDGVKGDEGDEDCRAYTLISGAAKRHVVGEKEKTDHQIVAEGGISLSFISVLPGLDMDGQLELERLFYEGR